jgi:uncharacterized protein (TIGR03084 family)
MTIDTTIFDDLVAELDRLEAILDDLDDAAWTSPSAAPGWTIADVVLHLAQTDEGVINSAATPQDNPTWREGLPTDEMVAEWVREDHSTPAEIFDRWRTARRGAVAALRAADPDQPLQWAAAPLKPRTLATTRIAEHWAHGLDITDPLAIPFPDTDRLRHIAWLGHGTLPYAFRLEGLEPHAVYCELTAPDGSTWRFGPPDADSSITGSAGAFCRVGARRLTPEASGLRAEGPHAAAALKVLRNYAG